jgi:hypothetical protein
MGKSVAAATFCPGQPLSLPGDEMNSSSNQRELRIAKTEALFRDVNERIAETSERFDSDAGVFMCECADPACAQRFEVSLAEYEDVRKDPTTFVLNPDHVTPDVETIIRHGRGYAVVRKFDAVVSRIVKKLDPRARPEPA